jgi:uncharacterized protein
MNGSPHPRTVAVTGATGLIGTALCTSLRASGHTVKRVVRSNATGNDVMWNPAAGTIDAAALDGVDAVVHLAGHGIGDGKWTDEHKKMVLQSRVQGTTLIAETIANMTTKPFVLASGSAIGFYGDRGSMMINEESPVGTGFLADVVAQWEACTAPAERAGIRTAHLRTGIVLSTHGGALKQQLLPFKLGVGGRLGKGTQYLPWITITDEVRAIEHVLFGESATPLEGAVNLTAPTPVTNTAFTKALGRALKRPTLIPIPLAPLKIMYGEEMVKEMLLSGANVMPTKLLDSGFTFRHANIAAALTAVLAEKL